MSRSILVHMFWPPLLLDLLLLLLLCRRRRRRYYCCCCCCCCAVTRSCVRSKKHKTRNSLLRRVVLCDASRVVKQQQHNSSTAAAQQQQQQRRRRWRRRGSISGQLPFGVSAWLLCCVSVAERVCALSLCVYIWLSLVTLESYTTTSKPSTNTSTTCDTPSIKVTIREVVISNSFFLIYIL